MYFDFEGRNFDTPTVESAISWREQALVSVVGHVLFALLVIYVPQLEFFQNLEERRQERLAELAELREQQQLAMAAAENDTFVFIAPRTDLESLEAPRPDAPLSDRDRVAQSPLRTLDPDNRLPIAEGTTSEFIESANPDEEFDPLAARDLESEVDDSESLAEAATDDDSAEDRLVDATAGQAEAEESPEGPSETPGQLNADRPGAGQFADSSLSLPGNGRGDPDDARVRPDLFADGLLGGARRGLQRSMQQQTFGNFTGDTGRYGPTISFDSKGVEFGPWIRRFQAQIYRNWFLPYRVWTDSGHVVLTFNIHRDGSMTDLSVLQPSRVDPFNHSAANALRMSNPTQPLPAEYPEDTVFFTVTFFFNEEPPSR